MQSIPPAETLLASMPSGREYHVPKIFIPPSLDEDAIVRMRAPPDPANSGLNGDGDDSADAEDRENAAQAPAGAFPGTRAEYTGGTTYY